MKTDSLIYRYLKEYPDYVFELIGRPKSDAARYQFTALEWKDTAVRLDGIYVPKEPDDREPVVFVEFQNPRSVRTYSNLMLKIGLYLEKINPHQNWHAIVIYPSRSVEQENLYPYRSLLESQQMTRIYVDDLRLLPRTKLGLRILRLILAKQVESMAMARELIDDVKASGKVAEKRRDMIDFVETVVAYQWPKLSREEIEKCCR